jgi:carbonic anhydrase
LRKTLILVASLVAVLGFVACGNDDGDLTTPPCTEGVSWFVLATPTLATTAQLSRYADLLHDNYRPTQPLNGRLVSGQ